jgi:glycosyltransferase involved in cell wall biosynthesis
MKFVKIPYEILVIDNSSTDNSSCIAKNAGAIVIDSSAKTVAKVRNEGVESSKGDLLVFLDADVSLSDPWGITLADIVADCLLESESLWGSHCKVPQSVSNPLFSWYLAIEKDARNTHLGSGHMIVLRGFFYSLGMFNETMKTGEDYEFCNRLVSNGGKIVINRNLVAEHSGYPQSIMEFIKREVWHGAGDSSTFHSLVNSKVAIYSLIFLILHLIIVLALVNSKLLVASIAFLLLIAQVIFFVTIKFGFSGIKSMTFMSVSAYFYLLGRVLSFKYLFKKGE